MNDFVVFSLNVNHMTNLGGMLAFVKQYKPHLVAIQEIVQTGEELSLLTRRYGYTAFVSLPSDGNPGISWIYRDNIPVKNIHVLQPGRLILLEIDGGPSFVNVYAPSGSQGRAARRIFFGDTILRNLSSMKHLPYLIGDFNCVISRQDTIDNFNNKNCPALSDLISVLSYSDGFRLLNPQAIEFTYSSPGHCPSRLDRVYVPAHSSRFLHQVSHQASLSDHKLLRLSLEWAAPAQLPGFCSPYWKLNISILRDEDFLQNFERQWNHLVDKIETFSSVSQWWESCFKPEITVFLKRFSKMKADCKRDTKRFLFFCLERALDDQDWEEVASVRSRIGEMLREDLYGFKLRSRDSSHAEEERGSLYHVAREARHGKSGSVQALSNGDSVTRDSKVIEDSIVNFFSSLFNGQHRTVPGSEEPVDTGVPFSPDISRETLFLSGLGKIKPEELDSLLEEVSLDELAAALKSCAREKSPGLDGLPYEFYQRVNHVIGPTLLTVFKEQLDQGILLPSFRRGVTRLLNKVSPQIPEVNQLRPITLLSADYKILTKIVTARLNRVLPSVLTSGQLCSRQSENILFGATNLISSLLSYQQHCERPGYIVSFDIFKAYDKTSIEFIVKVMRQMCFPVKFISWIRTLHHQASTCFILQHLSREVRVRFSVRQGDPLAMPLFLLNIEPLVVKIGTTITGAPVAGLQQRDEDYVDDVTCVSSCLQDLLILDELFLWFEELSGTVLNRSRKCQIMGLGSWAGKTDWPLSWLKTVSTMRIYGINFHETLEETSNATWKAVTAGLRSCLLSWQARDLSTLSSRVTVLKVFALSKLYYVAQVLPLPSSTGRIIRALVGQFLWKGRLEKLPLQEVYSPASNGGLGLPCIEARCEALLLTHTCRILSSNSRSKRHLAYWIGLSLRESLPGLQQGPNAEIIPKYFRQIISVFKHCEDQCVDPTNLKSVKCKAIYSDLTNSLPSPKIEQKHDRNWRQTWKRVSARWLPSAQRDNLFTLIHDIFPTNNRLFRMNLHPTGFCSLCQPGVEDTVFHKFTKCSLSSSIWNFVKTIVLNMTNISYDCRSLFYLDFPYNVRENDIVFIVSFSHTYIMDSLKHIDKPSLRGFVGALRQEILSNTQFAELLNHI